MRNLFPQENYFEKKDIFCDSKLLILRVVCLSQNYPNPFNPTTKIKFELPESSFTKLIIYDILGREVSTLVNEKLQPGTYEVEWNATNYPSGVYFYKLTILDPETSSGFYFIETKKLILIK